MRLILLTTLLLVLLSHRLAIEAFAGTTFTQLSKSVEIVDWDKWLKEKDKADEYARKVGAMVQCSSEVIALFRYNPL